MLTGLTLLQYRSHTRLDLAPSAQVVAIHGPNGAGKTNVLEALSLLSPGRGLRRAAREDLARAPGELGWKIRAEVMQAGVLREIETSAAPGSAREVAIDGKTAPQLALGGVLRVIWLVPAMDRLWTEAAEGRRRFLDRMVMSLAPGHAEAVLAYEKAMRERNRLLKEAVHDPNWYLALESRMAEAGAQIARNRAAALVRIGAAQGAGTGAFPAADLALDGGGPSEAEALAAELAAGRRRDMAAGRALVGPHRADLAARYAARDQPAAQVSTGEQKALLVSLILANARVLAGDGGAAPLLLLDEVAAHLDPGRRAALYEEIATLGVQAFLTGTEAALFEGLGARAQLVGLGDDSLPDGGVDR